MGLSFSSLFSSLSSLVRWSKEQDVRILMLGLDSAGKVRTQAFSLFLLTQCFPDDDTVQVTGMRFDIRSRQGMQLIKFRSEKLCPPFPVRRCSRLTVLHMT